MQGLYMIIKFARFTIEKTIMRYLVLLVAFLATSMACAQTPRTMHVVYKGTLIYAEPSYLSSVVDTLSPGDTVMVVSLKGKYARIVRDTLGRVEGGTEGFVLAANLSLKAPAAVMRSESAPKATPVVPASPRSSTPATTRTRSAPKAEYGACRATTRSGKPCSRKANGPEGYCWQHARTNTP